MKPDELGPNYYYYHINHFANIIIELDNIGAKSNFSFPLYASRFTVISQTYISFVLTPEI